MFTNHDSSSIRRVFRFILTLLLAMSFSASAQAGQPQEIQVFDQDDPLVYLPLVLKRGPLMESSGILDPSFGGDGLVNTNLGMSDEYAYGVAIQPDGKLVLAGFIWSETPDFTLARYNPDGSLDPGFGSGGVVVVDVAGWRDDRARAVALQPDGKILAAGYGWNAENLDFAMARFNPDGSLDTSFGVDGCVLTDFAGGNDIGFALALQTDNKILVAGLASDSSEDFGVARYNPDGSLDMTFSDDGKLVTDFSGESDWAYAVILQPDGKLVAAGIASGATADFALARYHPDGSLDLTFSDDGKLVTDFSEDNDWVYKVILQPDNKLVAVGYATGATVDFALARYLPDGSLDSSFDTDGLLVTDFSGGSDTARGGALQPDGKILLAGSTSDGTNQDIAVARYNTDGSLDSGFDGDGVVVTDMGGGQDSGLALALQTDGKIVVAGYRDGNSVDFSVVRYNSNGSLDTSFDSDGMAFTNIAGSIDEGAGIVLQPDGKLVVAGTSRSDFALARYHPDGSLDSSFGDVGLVTTDFAGRGEEGRAIALQADGKIMVAGYTNTSANDDFAVARYNPDGSLDASFDGDGLLSSDLSGGNDQGYRLALQADGKIVVVGYAQGATRDFAIVRFNPDGSLDNTFSVDGIVLTDFAGGDDEARDVTLQADGKIVVVGSANNGADSDFAVARYNTDGSLDNTFSGDGRVMTDFYDDEDIGNAVVLQPDGKIVVAGIAGSPIVDDFAVARYNPDGSLDTSFSGDGWVTIESGGPKHANAVVLQPNGKIVVAGWIVTEFEGGFPSDSDFALARFYPDGSLDTSFGSDGLVITNFESGRSECFEMALLPDGRIVAVGYVDTVTDEDFALVAYK